MTFLNQWLHLLAAVAAVGGTVFLRLVLLPSLAATDTELRKRIIGRFRPILFGAMGLLLVTGIYNAADALRLRGADPVYQSVLGLKIVLVLALFAIAAHLVLPTEQPNFFQRKPRSWLSVNLGLGVVILALSAYLRRSW